MTVGKTGSIKLRRVKRQRFELIKLKSQRQPFCLAGINLWQ